MRLWEMKKEHLEAHNRRLFVNKGVIKLFVNTDGECEIAILIYESNDFGRKFGYIELSSRSRHLPEDRIRTDELGVPRSRRPF